MHVRRKPLVFEAEIFEGFVGNPNPHPAVKQKLVSIDGVPTMLNVIDTLEGEHIVRQGDWIIKGIEGEYWPIKPDIFHKTYEIVGDPQRTTKQGEK